MTPIERDRQLAERIVELLYAPTHYSTNNEARRDAANKIAELLAESRAAEVTGKASTPRELAEQIWRKSPALSPDAIRRAEEHDAKLIDVAFDRRDEAIIAHLNGVDSPLGTKMLTAITKYREHVAAKARREVLEEAHKIFNWHDGVPNLSHWLKREIDKANRLATPPASGQAEASGEK
jgi:hypothetical protein